PEPWHPGKEARWRRFPNRAERRVWGELWERSLGGDLLRFFGRPGWGGYLLAAPRLERQARDYFVNQRLEAVAIGSQRLLNLVQGALVIRLDAASQRVGHDLLGEAARDFGHAVEQHGPHSGGGRE